MSQLFRLGTPKDFAYIFLLPLRKHVDGDMNTAQILYTIFNISISVWNYLWISAAKDEHIR